jgi:hypothetical protein
MRKTLTTIATAAAAIAASAGFATAAQATTPAATSGVLGAYAGDQVDGNQLAFDVYQQAPKVSQPVIAYRDSTTDQATDWAAYVPAGDFATGSKQFMYTPSGKLTGLCLSDPDAVYAGHANADALVLRTCLGDDAWQVWAYNGAGWTNAKTGLVITENGNAKQLTDAAAVDGSAGQTWTFSS